MPSPHQVQVNVLDGIMAPHSRDAGRDGGRIVKIERLEYLNFPYGTRDVSGLGTADMAQA